jgi:muramoyltetrapeptide carboxypeptidase
VKLGEHIRDQRGYLAGDDEARAADFMRIWCDPEVDGVMCLRGGYGSARIVDRLDYDAIAERPKVFVGFSDITSLHLSIGQRAGLVTFYGPMVINLAQPAAKLSYTREAFLKAVAQPEPVGEIAPDPDDPWVETVNGGVVEAELDGGCLTVIANALGTRDEPNWQGKIVFIEDVHEEPYAIDARLVQLLRAGKFEGIAGLVIAEHADVGPREFQPAFPSTLSFEDVIDDLLLPLGVPTIYNLPMGHGSNLATVPLGVTARLDADAGKLTVVESGVSAAAPAPSQPGRG